MAERITPREQDFSQWYQDIVIQSKMADYSPVKGCMVIRPNGYSIWENIQKEFDSTIKKLGVKNAYFPMFIPESFLTKEAEHVEGFAPQCAVVTYAGAKDLEEKLVVRPTSETIINSMFSKWIQSYRDLPLLMNQWANVVRWEMRTRLFIRTTEFLWQEGHTCHATAEEAESFTRKMLDVYADFVENTLAMPVIRGVKSENEKFAGALRTYCIEAMMQDKKALQAGTSHNLSTHFADAFNTKFLDKDGRQKLVHQTSWGVSTRLIGGLVMTHSDDKGLVLPPRLAATHVRIIPILSKKSDSNGKVLAASDKLAKEIQSISDLPYEVCVDVDRDETKQLGWKRHEAELVGIPIRIEIGPRDLENNSAVFVRRDLGEKDSVSLEELPKKVLVELANMQKELLESARNFCETNIFEVDSFDEFKTQLEEKGGFYKVSWSQNSELEQKIQEETKATLRCYVLNKNHEPIKDDRPCFYTGEKGNNVTAIFAKGY